MQSTRLSNSKASVSDFLASIVIFCSNQPLYVDAHCKALSYCFEGLVLNLCQVLWHFLLTSPVYCNRLDRRLGLGKGTRPFTTGKDYTTTGQAEQVFVRDRHEFGRPPPFALVQAIGGMVP